MKNFKFFSLFLVVLFIMGCATKKSYPQTITLFIDNFKLETKIKSDNTFHADVVFEDFRVLFAGTLKRESDGHLINVEAKKIRENTSFFVNTSVLLLDMDKPFVIGEQDDEKTVSDNQGNMMAIKEKVKLSIMLSE